MKKTDAGVSATEYGLLAALISVAMLVGLTALGHNVKTTFCYIANQISGTVSSTCVNVKIPTSTSASSDTGEGASASGSSSPIQNITSNYIDQQFGGTGSLDTDNDYTNWNAYSTDWMADTSQLLKEFNNIDPITGVYGVYDQNGNPTATPSLSDITDILDNRTLMNGNENYLYTAGGQNDYFELTTASGNVYEVKVGGGYQQTELVNKATGLIYECQKCLY